MVRDMRATAYDIPEGCCAGYDPECNPLIPWWAPRRRQQHAGSKIDSGAGKTGMIEVSFPTPRKKATILLPICT